MVMDVSGKTRTTEEEVDEQHQVGTIPLVTFTYHQGGGGREVSQQTERYKRRQGEKGPKRVLYENLGLRARRIALPRMNKACENEQNVTC